MVVIFGIYGCHHKKSNYSVSPKGISNTDNNDSSGGVLAYAYNYLSKKISESKPLNDFANMMMISGEGIPIGEALKMVTESTKEAELLAKGAPKAENAVIGKMPDLTKSGAIKEGEYTVAEKLPNLGEPKANWTQNSSVLRQEMGRGVPIRDASVNPKTGALENNTGFLKAERNLLGSKGWKYDPSTQKWYPPTKK